jgi:hypothetical protein
MFNLFKLANSTMASWTLSRKEATPLILAMLEPNVLGPCSLTKHPNFIYASPLDHNIEHKVATAKNLCQFLKDEGITVELTQMNKEKHVPGIIIFKDEDEKTVVKQLESLLSKDNEEVFRYFERKHRDEELEVISNVESAFASLRSKIK